jgi:hypothetical protein
MSDGQGVHTAAARVTTTPMPSPQDDGTMGTEKSLLHQVAFPSSLSFFFLQKETES